MPDKPKNPFQFWEELKRRRVVRVIPVYAAAAFVLLELVDIISEPFGLPDWTLKLVVVLLSIGFIVSIILSWIYDVTPGGIQKTKSSKDVQSVEAPPASKGWKVTSFVSILIIITFAVFYLVGNTKRSSDISTLEKSIAVRPFVSLSDDPEKQYLADGVMDAILLHLSKIEDLRVMSRTSVEQYRETDKTAIVIGQELHVGYLLEGSFQKYDDNAKLNVHLIKTDDDSHVWSNEYDRNWNDIFEVQSQVAQTIAKELQAVITHKEKQLIEKIPTTNLTAYDFYQRGREEHLKYWLDNNNRETLERAEDFYFKALDYDSTFARAYTGLALLFWDKHYWETYFLEDFGDSVLHLANTALSFDNELPEVHFVKGGYYREKNKPELAMKEYEKAIKFNPNYWQVYSSMKYIYDWIEGDIVKAIENGHRALSIHRGRELPDLLNSLSFSYRSVGFNEKALLYIEEAFKLNNDSINYYVNIATGEQYQGNYVKAQEFLQLALKIDSSDVALIRRIGGNYMFLGLYEESLNYYKNYIEKLNQYGVLDLGEMHRIALAFWKKGNKNKANRYFKEQINYCLESIKLDRRYAMEYRAHYDLAAVYAFQGYKKKAYQYLDELINKDFFPLWWVNLIKSDPLFDSIRDEPEFQQIVKDVEAKYQTEHERVRIWLEENDML